MKYPTSRHNQSGVTLVIGLIMLVLITLIVTTAFSLSSTNLKSVGNMQARAEALTAANTAIEVQVGSNFTSPPTAITDWPIDIDDDGDTDYLVDIDTPACVQASQAIHESLSSVTLPTSMSSTPYWNTIWDFNAIATDERTGAAVRVRHGVRVLLTESQKNALCT